jgi:hypothetical protein
VPRRDPHARLQDNALAAVVRGVLDLIGLNFDDAGRLL